MPKFRCQRRLAKVGHSSYIPLPRQALLDLRLFVGDWVEFELDTDTHTVTFRAAVRRDVMPTIGPKSNTRDMVPLQGSEPPAPAPSDPRQRQLVEAG